LFTYAHKDIAFEFGSWLSPVFKLYLITEYLRPKEAENDPMLDEWNVLSYLYTPYRVYHFRGDNATLKKM